MMMDEGYIKFEVDWKETLPFETTQLAQLIYWRQKIFELGLIGMYENGIGFGNISQRIGNTNHFFISASKTGNLRQVDAAHFAKVVQVSIDRNYLYCEGPSIASSESMSHAVIYAQCPWVNGIIHGHQCSLWQQLLRQVPTTSKDIAYGTPEMAYAIIDLLQTPALQHQHIFAMEGHEEGFFTFGESLAAAAEVIMRWLTKSTHTPSAD